jgi:large subunit ribosomal protein L14
LKKSLVNKMIQAETRLTVADNSGGKVIMCVGIEGRKYARMGDIIIAVVKKSIPNLAVKRHDIIRALVVRTTVPIKRPDGSLLEFDNNAAVIINKDGTPVGTRIFGPVAWELKDMGYTQIFLLAERVM